jgi:hypothetical protein
VGSNPTPSAIQIVSGSAGMVRFESLQLDAAFERERAKMRGTKPVPRQIHSISKQEAHNLVFRWFIDLEEMSESWWENDGRHMTGIRETRDFR